MGRHLARLPSAILPSPQCVLMETSAAIWDHTQTVGWEMCACQETLCVLHPVTPPPPLSARLGRSSATWGPLLRAAGWEITVWLRALTVQLSVTLLLLHSVVPLSSGVTWELRMAAGWEISVCRRGLSVLLLQAKLPLLRARSKSL